MLKEKELTDQVLAAAIEVHRGLGPGLLESTYQACMAQEFIFRGIRFEQEKPIAVNYKGVHVDCGYRLDFVVQGKVVLELKSVDAILPVHEAQLLTYLRLTGCPVGLLINFNTAMLKDGIRRRVL